MSTNYFGNVNFDIIIEVEGGKHQGQAVDISDGEWQINGKMSDWYEYATTVGGPENLGHPEDYDYDFELVSAECDGQELTSPKLLNYLEQRFLSLLCNTCEEMIFSNLGRLT